MSTLISGQKLRYRGDVESPTTFVRAARPSAAPIDRVRSGVPGASLDTSSAIALDGRAVRKARARKARRKLSADDAGAAECATLQLMDHEIDYLSRSLKALTSRECEVVFSICRGGTNEWMADALRIALPTLRTHLMRLNQKLGTTSKGDVVRFVAKALLEGYRSGHLEPAPEASPAAEAVPV